MSATLTVIYWRDIPSQVIATDGTVTARRQLDDRFMQAIDSAAMRAGLIATDDYLEHWRREARSCGDEVEAEADAEATRIEQHFDQETLLRLTRSGGLAEDTAG